MTRTVMALMLREIATTYGRSAGGYFWAIIEPVLGIALLSVIFSLALRSPGLGTNFALFYASGYLPFAMTLQTINKVGQSVRFSRPFMAYPCVTFMDALVARLLLNALTNVVVMAVVLFGIMVIFGLPIWADLGSLAMSISLAMLLASGIGTLNCYMMTSFPIYEQIWAIATRPLFIISAVFFTFETLPAVARDILWYNPLVHIVGLMRRGLYPTYDGEYISPLFVTLVGGITLFFGLLLLSRHFKQLMEA
ncbi:sugar ABC transporter permease [Paracoccus tegillarcae]|uniref:Transport permease protein n=2 Tax=Paracoccus tegillarcae TaxID=1529068 RepID=A0A2K9EWF7_9RHOB|nr:ABC transporter permease [Paracoccus tegillarcae]AUH35266.1 sugar ABC transporter permease [Paracoccus tegillarcae]